MTVRSYWRERAALLAAVAAQVIVLALLWLVAPGLRGARTDLLYALLVLGSTAAIGFTVDYLTFRARRREVERLLASEQQSAERLAAREAASREDVDFFGAWIHELKTPVSVLRLALPPDGPPELLRQLDRLEQNIDRAMYYLRGASLEHDLVIRPVELRRLADERVAALASAAGAARQQLVVSGHETEVDSDPKWLGFVLDQLLQNAIRYTPAGGTIAVAVTPHEPRSGRPTAALTVTDNGPGIPEAELPRIFDRGFTGTRGREHGGTSGMGLYLARKLSDRLGHRLRLACPPGGGTVATVEFPRWGDELAKVTES